MHVLINGYRLPGRTCDNYANVHVGLQVGSQPHDLVPGDADEAHWKVDVDVVARANDVDFRGPAVHGRPGERFLYLTWGELDGDRFSTFRRAKLMLAGAGVDASTQELSAEISLTGKDGLPCCARLHEPTIQWTSR